MSDVREFFDGLETYIQIVLILEYSVTADMLSAVIECLGLYPEIYGRPFPFIVWQCI